MTETTTVPLPLPEIKPNPDPTERTIEQIRREVTMLREILEQRLDGIERQFIDRDKAIDLIQRQVDREPKPPVLEAAVTNLKEMLQKMEENISLRFAERDKRNEQMIKDSKSLVDNTIGAMKDAFNEQTRSSQAAIGKSETSISKQMDQIESKFGTEIKALTGNINDIKNDIVSMKSSKEGSKESKEDFKSVWAIVAGIVALLISGTSVVYTMSRSAPVVQVVPSNISAPSGQSSQ